MKFQKGVPRHPNAGRKKGSLNKRKIPKVADYLADRGLNPAEEILKLLDDEEMKPRDKIAVWTDLLSYCQGKVAAETMDDNGAEADAELLERFEDVSNETLLKLVKQADEAE